MIPLIVAFENNPPYVYTDSSGELKGNGVHLYQDRTSGYFPGFQIIWNGNASHFGNCSQKTCHGIAQLIASGQADVYVRPQNYDILENGLEANISFSAPIKESSCSFISLLDRQPKQYSLDCIKSFSIFSTELTVFIVSIFLIMMVVSRLTSLTTNKSASFKSKMIGFLQIDLTKTVKPAVNQSNRIIYVSINLSLFSLLLIYTASFQTDLSMTERLTAIDTLKDLAKQNISCGVLDLSHCHRLLRKTGNPQILSKIETYGFSTRGKHAADYYRDKLDVKFYSIFGDELGLIVFHMTVCSLDRIFHDHHALHKSKKRYFRRRVAFLYNSYLDSTKKRALIATSYAISENKLIKSIEQKFQFDLVAHRTKQPIRLTCLHRTTLKSTASYRTLSLQNYIEIFKILLGVIMLGFIVLTFELFIGHRNHLTDRFSGLSKVFIVE